MQRSALKFLGSGARSGVCGRVWLELIRPPARRAWTHSCANDITMKIPKHYGKAVWEFTVAQGKIASKPDSRSCCEVLQQARCHEQFSRETTWVFLADMHPALSKEIGVGSQQ